jgi:hypothetical protein
MPTATTTREDSLSKMAQNHPHDFTMRLKKDALKKRACTSQAFQRGLMGAYWLWTCCAALSG